MFYNAILKITLFWIGGKIIYSLIYYDCNAIIITKLKFIVSVSTNRRKYLFKKKSAMKVKKKKLFNHWYYSLWPHSLSSSSVHGIFQARILEWVSISSSGDLPDPGIKLTHLASPALADRFFTIAQPEKPHKKTYVYINMYDKNIIWIYIKFISWLYTPLKIMNDVMVIKGLPWWLSW